MTEDSHGETDRTPAVRSAPRPTIICLTPVRNEAWILERFLRCASLWADHIIVADQGSTDGSREIALRFPKVRLIDNTERAFNEPERQQMLIAEARRIPGPRLLVALDADEFLTADFASTVEWRTILAAPPGTVIQFQWACVMPDRHRYFIYPAEFPLAFMDDGSPHQGLAIHSPRLPLPADAMRLLVHRIRVIHLSLIDPGRYASKVRWYQCWEHLQKRWNGRLARLYRFYHACDCIPEAQLHPLPDRWTDGYGGSDAFLAMDGRDHYHWDAEVLRLFQRHGTRAFRRLAVWDVDWNEVHLRIHGEPPPAPLADPRNAFERWVHRRLAATQWRHDCFAQQGSRPQRGSVRWFERLAALAGW
jgi:glycosyltransferase involved in cell wall biosynthesis